MTGPLHGRSALVTGAGRGMGRAIALRLAHDGAAIAVNDVAPGNGAEAVAGEIVAAGGQAIPVCGDVANSEDVHQLVDLALGRLGCLDIVVNNAAIFPWRAWTEIAAEEWDRVMAVNVRGAMLCAQAAFPALRESVAGRVITMSSTTWLSGHRNLLHYATSKAALVGFTRCLAAEVGDYGITANAVSAGRTLTEGVQEWIDTGVMDLHEAVTSRQQQPIKRMGEPHEVAAAVAFLASDDAAFITGQLINVDGGRNMH